MKFSFSRVESLKISSHRGRYLLERMLKLSDAGVKNRWIERLDKFSQYQDIIYDFKAEIQGIGSRSWYYSYIGY